MQIAQALIDAGVPGATHQKLEEIIKKEKVKKPFYKEIERVGVADFQVNKKPGQIIFLKEKNVYLRRFDLPVSGGVLNVSIMSKNKDLISLLEKGRRIRVECVIMQKLQNDQLYHNLDLYVLNSGHTVTHTLTINQGIKKKTSTREKIFFCLQGGSIIFSSVD